MNYELMPLLRCGAITGWAARCLHCLAANSGPVTTVKDAEAWMAKHDREHGR